MTETLVTRIRIQEQPQAARIRLQRNEPPIRLRTLPQLQPLNISMRATATEIQYQIGESGPWIDLIALSEFAQPYTTVIETGAGPFSIDPGTVILALNKTIASPTTLQLPTVASRSKLSLTIVDWGGNAGDITLNAVVGETIMGVSSTSLVSNAQGLGAAAAVTLFPSTDLAGWLAI